MSKGQSKAPSQRQLRVGELVRHALISALGSGEVRDPHRRPRRRVAGEHLLVAQLIWVGYGLWECVCFV